MACAADHPIVFVTDDKQSVFPVALLSLERGRNAHVSPAGDWDGTYVPAFFRQYPFVLSDDDTVCFDEASDALSRDVGEPLFQETGNGPKLDQTIAFLAQYRKAAEHTKSVCGKIAALELLKPWALEITRDGAPPAQVKGFSIIDEERLTAVRLNLLDRINASAMGWVYAHLVSLAHFKRLGASLQKSSPPPKAGSR